jgi:hypothetical protein
MFSSIIEKKNIGIVISGQDADLIKVGSIVNSE